MMGYFQPQVKEDRKCWRNEGGNAVERSMEAI